MHRLSRRWIAGVAALALFVAMLGYASHHHDARDSAHNDTHCDLCLQLGAAAGAPGLILHSAPVTEIVYLLPVTSRGFQGVSRPVRIHQPRAPPGFLPG